MSQDRRVLIRGKVKEGMVDLGTTNKLALTHILSIVFYDDEEALPEHAVDKANMSGSIHFSASETGVEYTPLNSPTITLGTTDYERPVAFGSYAKFRMDMSSVVGATHYIVCLVSAGGV